MRPSRWTILFLFLCQIVYSVSGQTSEPPKPRMTKLLMKDFINMHMQYPETALNQKIQGTVLIAFDTDREGKVTERKVIQTVSPEIDSSALALFDLILWEPAKYYGKPKNGNGEFKLKYNISKYESLVKKRGYDHFSLPVEPVDLSGTI